MPLNLACLWGLVNWVGEPSLGGEIWVTKGPRLGEFRFSPGCGNLNDLMWLTTAQIPWQAASSIFDSVQGLPCGSAGKESAGNAGDLGLIPGLGRSPGEGKGCPLQYPGLENSMDCTVHGVAKSWIWLSDFHIPLSFSGVCWLECFRLRWKERPYSLGRQRVFALRTRKQRLALWSWHPALLHLRGSVRWLGCAWVVRACCLAAGAPCAVFRRSFWTGWNSGGMLASPKRLEWWSSNLFQCATRGSLTLSQLGRWARGPGCWVTSQVGHLLVHPSMCSHPPWDLGSSKLSTLEKCIKNHWHQWQIYFSFLGTGLWALLGDGWHEASEGKDLKMQDGKKAESHTAPTERPCYSSRGKRWAPRHQSLLTWAGSSEKSSVLKTLVKRPNGAPVR